jgi:3-hydroxyisobutyrate dehydrogenase-like beta-hydroxyacid dehydrogenase
VINRRKGTLLTQEIGFVGLGNIGRPMALNVLKRFGQLTVFDIDGARVRALAEAGAFAAVSLAELASKARVILLSLPTSAEVERVLVGDDGIAGSAAPGTLVIDLTSGSPPRSQDIAKRLAEHSIRYIDAGVSGGVAGAEAATLGIMIGGDDADVANAMPYLQAIGKTIVHMGPVGAGHMTKALNNLLLAANMVVASEALALAAKAGLAPEKVVAAINGSSGRSYITEYRFPNFILKGDFSSRGGMAMSLLVKDVAIACDAAKSSGVTMFVGNLVHQMLMRISDELGSTAPNQSVARAIVGWAGVQIRSKSKDA